MTFCSEIYSNPVLLLNLKDGQISSHGRCDQTSSLSSIVSCPFNVTDRLTLPRTVYHVTFFVSFVLFPYKAQPFA
jgi:hypothetical protein